MLKKFSASIALAALVLIVTPVCADNHDDLNPGIWDPDTMPFGKTYGEWGGDWWNWAIEPPQASSPLFDPTGMFNEQRQSGPVWFLGGNFGGTSVRNVTMPGPVSIFFPFLTSVQWVPEDGATEADVRATANAAADSTSVIETTVDGVGLQNLFSYRAESPPGGFVLDIPTDSLLHEKGFSPGDRDPAVTAGYWIILEPLAVGDHVINFHGVATTDSGPDVESDVTYNLTVIPELPGDFDLDLDVDGFDYLTWQQGKSTNPLSQSDLADWEANFGTTASPTTVALAAVPEPTTALMLLIGVVILLTGRRTLVCSQLCVRQFKNQLL